MKPVKTIVCPKISAYDTFIKHVDTFLLKNTLYINHIV